METLAYLILRLTFAWMFLYPLKALLSDWQGSVDMVRLLINWKPQLCAGLMILSMMVGSLSILLGIYAQLGGLIIFIFCILGAITHYRVAAIAESKMDENQEIATMAMVGHQTSAQKNFMIAAAALFIFLMGAGPMSLTGNLF